MYIINYFFNKNEKINQKNDNKCPMIEYLIILKLIMNKKNIYFDNNFYIDLMMYLRPRINNKIYKEIIIKKEYKSHYESYLLIDFINKYNLKKEIINSIDKNIIDNNTYVYLTFTKKSYYETDIINIIISIEKYNIFISTNYYLFVFDIPLSYLEEITGEIITYNFFNNFSLYIYENNHGILMSDYIYSEENKKILYYHLFNKIIYRQIIE